MDDLMQIRKKYGGGLQSRLSQDAREKQTYGITKASNSTISKTENA